MTQQCTCVLFEASCPSTVHKGSHLVINFFPVLFEMYTYVLISLSYREINFWISFLEFLSFLIMFCFLVLLYHFAAEYKKLKNLDNSFFYSEFFNFFIANSPKLLLNISKVFYPNILAYAKIFSIVSVISIFRRRKKTYRNLV